MLKQENDIKPNEEHARHENTFLHFMSESETTS